MKVLVTGGAGFLGSHLIDELVLHRWNPWVLDAQTYAATNWEYVQTKIGNGLVKGDVRDPDSVAAMMMKRPDVVLHLAAQSHVDASLEYPAETMLVNAVGTQIVATFCAQLNVPLVYCSTDEVYGDMYGTDWAEGGADEYDTPLAPSSPYSAGKAAGELAVHAAARSFGLKAVITRGCNAYGPRQCIEKLVPIACRLLQQGQKVPMHGGGLQVRQWIAAEEFAVGLRLAAEEAVGLDSGEVNVYNLAGPIRCTVLSLIGEMALHLDTPDGQAWELANERPGQDRSYNVSGVRAAKAWGYRPKAEIWGDIPRLLEAYPADGEVKLTVH